MSAARFPIRGYRVERISGDELEAEPEGRRSRRRPETGNDLRALLPCPLPDAGDGDGLAGAGISALLQS